MPTNDFVPFATGGSANVESQASYLSDSNRTNGNQPGVASSALNNKALRQATSIAAALAQYMCNATGNNVADDGVQSELLNTLSQIISGPTGTIHAFGGTVAPYGFLLCDGSAVSRTTYANLFAVVGTNFGSGDGSTTFNLPNSSGLFLRGAGSQSIGGVSHSATLGATAADKMQGHYHGTSESPHSHGPLHGSYLMSDAGAIPNAGATYGNSAATTAPASTGLAVTAPATDGTNGTPRIGTETAPASLGVNYIIKT